MSDVTPKQEAFLNEYLKDFNGKHAAIRAGYSETSAQSTSSEILSYPNVQERLKILIKERTIRGKVDPDKVLTELANLAFSSMKNYAKWNASAITLKDSDELDDIDARCISELSQTSSSQGPKVKIKLHDKLKALLALAEHTGILQNATEQQQNEQTKTELFESIVKNGDSVAEICKELPQAAEDNEEEISD